MTVILSSTLRKPSKVAETNKRFIREVDAAEQFGIEVEDLLQVAQAAGALYELPRTTLIHMERLDKFMKHIYKVPGTFKNVRKEFVRIGEGSIMYSIGHHRFIEMARAAGAVYKINEGTGGTVLINLELFDQYMEQFREAPVPLKHPLGQTGEVE